MRHAGKVRFTCRQGVADIASTSSKIRHGRPVRGTPPLLRRMEPEERRLRAITVERVAPLHHPLWPNSNFEAAQLNLLFITETYVQG
jgi:hypothetical protein